MRLSAPLERLAETPALDKPAGWLRDTYLSVLRSPKVRDALHGVWLGHPLHPVLAQVPIGSYTSAAVLDLLPGAGAGERRAATVLVGLGLVSTFPAAAAGAADYTQGHEEQQRTGVVHVAANVAAVACYLVSLRARLRGHRTVGVATGLAGLAFVGVAGMIGGHLSYRQASGVNHAEDVPHVAVGEWCDLGPLDDLPTGRPAQRIAGDVPVMLVRDGDQVLALADRCSHASGPLHEGQLSRRDGVLCVECPWHKTVFAVADGAIVTGPATAPQPGFDVRIVAGRVQAKVRMIPGVPAR